MINKITKLLLPAAFLLTVFAVPVISFLHTDKKIDAAENRVLQTLPSFSDNTAKDFFNKMSLYFNDHFGWRKKFINIHRDIKEGITGNSTTHTVIMGKNNYAFFSQSVELYEGKRNEQLINGFIDQLNTFVKTIQNKPIFLIVAPNKAFIYDQYLPTYVKKSNQRQETIQKLKSIQNLHVLDLYEPIRTEQKPTYMRYETHWNGWGAYVAYNSTIDFINEKSKWSLPLKTDIKEIKETKYSGDLAKMMDKEGQLFDTNSAVLFNNVTATRTSKAITTETSHVPDYKNPNGKANVFVLHDSFMQAHLGRYLSHSFNKMTNLWSFDFKKAVKIVKEVNPDMILIEIVDRHIY